MTNLDKNMWLEITKLQEKTLPIVDKMPKNFKFTLGDRMLNYLLDCSELVLSKLEDKYELIISKLLLFKHISYIAFSVKAISLNQTADIAVTLHNRFNPLIEKLNQLSELLQELDSCGESTNKNEK